MKYYIPKHHRRSIRLKNYDYSLPGGNFITICTYNRECLFGEINAGEMILHEFGNIIGYKWQNIPNHFGHVQLDAFQIMPDHVHGIIFIKNIVGAKHSHKKMEFDSNIATKNASPLPPQYPSSHPIGTKPGYLSAIIQNFSSITTRKINQIRQTPGFKVWQRNYFAYPDI
jgi:REP element-mobilizing transposase RayT